MIHGKCMSGEISRSINPEIEDWLTGFKSRLPVLAGVTKAPLLKFVISFQSGQSQ